MLDKLGEELKEARLKNEITIQQMASKTRIDQKFLEALENGNFYFLPELYVKAFLKEYSKYVGLDEATILKKYEYAKQGKNFDEKIVHAEENKVSAIEEHKKEEPVKQIKHSPPLHTFDSMQPEAPSDSNAAALNRRRILLAGVIGGTIVVIAAIYFLFFNDSSEIVVPEKPIDEVIESSEKFYEDEAKPEPVSDTTASVFSAGGDSLQLEIRTSDTSWVKITLDDTKTDEFILFPNAKKNINTLNNFKIIFGRAQAVKLALNGAPLNYSPGNVNVSRILIDSSGLKYLENPLKSKQGTQ